MPTDVIMPQMGESIFEGTITKWLKQPGEKVQRDEPLFEISTDKVDAEIPAPASGTLQDIKVQAGATVQVNTVVGTIAEEGAAASSSGAAGRRPGAGTGRRQAPASSPRQPLRRRQKPPRLRRTFLPISPAMRRKVWSGSSRARFRKWKRAASRTACAPARWSGASRKRIMST